MAKTPTSKEVSNIDYKQATIDAVSYLLKQIAVWVDHDDINGKVRLIITKEATKKVGHSYSGGLRIKNIMTIAMPWLSFGFALQATAAVIWGGLTWDMLNILFDHGIVCARRVWEIGPRQMTLRLRPLVQTWLLPNLFYDLGAISMRMSTKIMHKEELEEREVASWRQNVATKT